MVKKFIRAYVFDTNFYGKGWDFPRENLVKEDYERWNYLKAKLVQGASIYDLEDFVVGAKRLINHRTKKLFSLYGLKENLKQLSRKGDLNLLQELDIARPYLLNKLREIRNQVEHEFRLALDLNACQDYLDICWYYLRSTDYFFIRQTIELESSQDNLGERESEVFSIEFDTQTMSLSFAGRIHKDDISDSFTPDCAEIEIITQETFYRDENSFRVKAGIVGPETVTLTVIKNFFRTIDAF
jgi:hypothetical protein